MFSGAGVGVASPRAHPQQAPGWGFHTCPQKQGLGSSLCLCLHTLSSFSSGSAGKEPVCQCRRLRRRGLDPWVRQIPWRRKWQPIPVTLPGELHGQRNQVGYSLWDLKETPLNDTTFTFINVCVCIYICTPHFLYPFICQRTLRLFRCIGYCE